MSQTYSQPIKLIRRTRTQHARHGGSWKVAYADFVSAMMALFMALWLLHAPESVQLSIGGYFRNPRIPHTEISTSLIGTGQSISNQKNLQMLEEKFMRAMKHAPEFEKIKNYVKISITSEGLRIELLESEKGMFFGTGEASPTGYGAKVLGELGKQLGEMPNTIAIEGHTDSRPYRNHAGYTNWELSAARANAARKVMLQNGLRPDQVVQIAGFADQRLRLPEEPENASNRRISIIVRYLNHG
jgi:chemotaxis protein MotB